MMGTVCMMPFLTYMQAPSHVKPIMEKFACYIAVSKGLALFTTNDNKHGFLM